MKNFKRIVAVAADGVTFACCLVGSVSLWAVMFKGMVEPTFGGIFFAIAFTVGTVRSIIRKG